MHGGARNDIHDRNGEHDARDHSYIPDDGDRGRSHMRLVVTMHLQAAPNSLQSIMIFWMHHHKRRDPSRGIVHGFIV